MDVSVLAILDSAVQRQPAPLVWFTKIYIAEQHPSSLASPKPCSLIWNIFWFGLFKLFVSFYICWKQTEFVPCDLGNAILSFATNNIIEATRGSQKDNTALRRPFFFSTVHVWFLWGLHSAPNVSFCLTQEAPKIFVAEVLVPVCSFAKVTLASLSSSGDDADISRAVSKQWISYVFCQLWILCVVYSWF